MPNFDEIGTFARQAHEDCVADFGEEERGIVPKMREIHKMLWQKCFGELSQKNN